MSVTASALNIRQKPNIRAAKVTGRAAARYGAILRVYEIEKGWYKISGWQAHWVFGRHTQEVLRATVRASSLNVRDLPSIKGSKIGSVTQGEELFIYEEINGWCRISVEDKWVKKEFLSL